MQVCTELDTPPFLLIPVTNARDTLIMRDFKPGVGAIYAHLGPYQIQSE